MPLDIAADLMDAPRTNHHDRRFDSASRWPAADQGRRWYNRSKR